MLLCILFLFPLPVVAMEAGENIGPYKFNISFAKSVPHILESIYFSLDFESFKTCLEVSTTWRDVLTSESYLKKAKTVFHGEIVCDEEKLWQAAEEGNVEEVRSLSGSIFVNVNYAWGANHFTPLCSAVYSDCKDVIQLLLERGADPDLPDYFGYTPLHRAMYHGNKDVVQLLLDGGANLNITNKCGETPLHIAAFVDQRELVQLLLNAGAELNITSYAGHTPLSKAQLAISMYGRSMDIVDILNDALKHQ